MRWRHFTAVAALLALLALLAATAALAPTAHAAAPGSWATVAPMPTARASLAAATGADGRIYALGGISNNSAVSTAEAYDPATNSWATLAPMPTARENLAAATGPDGRIYAIGGGSGGSALATVEAYDPATNSWATLAPMPTAREGLAAVTAPDGRIYALGGGSGGSALATVEAYDPVTNSWTTLAPMPTARFGLAAAMGSDGRIYALGGLGFSFLNTAEAYDPATNSWTSVAPMPTARTYLAAATGPDGHIYAIGGEGFSGRNLATVEAYDPATNSWTSVAPMPTGRRFLAATTGADGRIYAIGGDDGSNDLATAEAYTSAASTSASWICSTDDLAPGCSANSLAPMSTGRDASAAATGPDGRIYVLGGNGVNAFLASGEAYTPAANTWAAIASMPTAREFLAAATGLDGRIYALGGYSSSAIALAAAEAYTPATNTWATLAPMPTARYGLAAVTGRDGRIYVFGGDNSSSGGRGLTTVEAYDPATDSWICSTDDLAPSGCSANSLAPMPTARLLLAAALGADGRIYVLGGGDGSTNGLPTAEAYDPATNSWATLAPMPTGRYGLAAATGPDGRIYALGGNSTGSYIATAEAYTPATNSWATLTPMPSAREFLAAATGPDGRIYALGGQGSSGSAIVEAYGAATSTPSATATMLTSSANPSVVGQAVTYTATVSPMPDGGTVSFADGGVAITSCGAVSVNTSTGIATCPVTYASSGVGSHTITASYSGDPNFASSDSTGLIQVVNQASPTLTTTASPSSATGGDTLSDSAVLAGGFNPTGAIVFNLVAPDGKTVVDDEQTLVNGDGTYTTPTGYTLPTSGTVTGVYHWIAEYLGDANNVSATDQGGAAEQVTVALAITPTTTTLSSSVNPSVSGQSVTYTAAVSPAPNGGTVSFSDGGSVISGCGTVNLDTGTGVATCSVTYAGAGSHTIIASYSGDPNFASSVSATLSQQVNRASTATTLSSSANPVAVGQAVTFTTTVAVTAPGAGAPTGTVKFADGGVAITGCGAVSLNPSTAVATCPVTFAVVGSHTITATYSGDSNFTGSMSAGLPLQVNQASTTTSLAVTIPIQPSGLPAGIAVSVAGQKVTYTATVSPIPDGGLLTFKDGATTLCSNVPLSPSGTATCSKTYSAAGQHSITATYSGNAKFKSSSANLTLYENTNISRYLKNGVYNLSRLNLAGGYFFAVNLSGANMSSGNFSGANFTDATLSRANLSSGNFSGAKFAGANLSGANLTRANLKGATGLASATLSGVIWSSTTCPDNTSSNRDGGTCVGHL